MNNKPQNYTGQNLSAPIYVTDKGIITDPQIKMARAPFYLERYDFSKIIKSDGPWYTFGLTLSGAAIGLLINMLGKLIGNKIDPSIRFDTWELYSFGVASVLTILSFSIHLLVPNEKRKIVKIINKHFDHA